MEVGLAESVGRAMRLDRCSSLPNALLHGLALHLVAEFGHLYPMWNVNTAVEELAQDSGKGLPLHLVAVENDRAIGIVSVIADDEVTGWEGKGWWLANVFVLPEFRGRGVGTSLIDRAAEIARESGALDLHLVTDTFENWYSKHDWQRAGVGEVHGNEMVVMHRKLGTNAQT